MHPNCGRVVYYSSSYHSIGKFVLGDTMITLRVLPNNPMRQRLLEQHILELPACCPISKNPRPGSKITIAYRAKDMVLDVTPLYAYINQFVGGLYNATGKLKV